MEQLIKNTRAIRKTWHKFVQMGAVAPSSRFLAKRMADFIQPKEDIVVVELGAGTGSLTKAILKKLPASGKLFSLEIDKELATKMRRTFTDPRLEIIIADAARLSHVLNERGIVSAHYIVSGLPLGNFSAPLQRHVLREIGRCLKEKGYYIQFQYLLVSILRIKQIFPHVEISFEPRNIPPAFVIICKK